MSDIFLIILGGWLVYDMFKALEYHNNNVLPPNEGFGCNEIKHCYYFIEGLKNTQYSKVMLVEMNFGVST